MPYTLADNDTYEEILEDVYKGKKNDKGELKDYVIHHAVVKGYKDNFLHGINQVLNSSDYGTKYYNLQKQLEANVTRFSYYKAYKVTSLINQYKKETKNKKEYMSVGKAILNSFNRYQATEYNTAVARSRTAKQWSDFNSDEINKRLFPNIRWIASRSSNPREAHKPFYDKVWAKDDPFWLSNQPGSLWNCKCDWQETSEAVTDGNPTSRLSEPGLRGNPAITGKIFSDDASYFKNIKNEEVVNKIIHSIDRKETINSFLDKEKKITKNINENPIEISFNYKGIAHFANDLKNDDKLLLKNRIFKDIKYYIKNAKFVGWEENKKTDKKPNADIYYYFEILFPNKEKGYIAIEKQKGYNKFILYSITNKLRESIHLA